MKTLNKSSKNYTKKKKKIHKGGEIIDLERSLREVKEKLKFNTLLSQEEIDKLTQEKITLREEKNLKVALENVMREDSYWGKQKYYYPSSQFPFNKLLGTGKKSLGMFYIIPLHWFRSRDYEEIEVDSRERQLLQELIKEKVKPEHIIKKKNRFDVLSLYGTKRNNILQSAIDEKDSEIAKLKTQIKSSNSNTETALALNKQFRDRIEELESEKKILIKKNQEKGKEPISWNQWFGETFNFSVNDNNEIDFEKKKIENIIRGLAILGITSTMGLILYKVTKKVFKSTFNQEPTNNTNLLIQIEKPEKPPQKTTDNYLDNLQLGMSQMYIDNQMEVFLFFLIITLLYSLFYTKRPNFGNIIYNTIFYGVIPNLFLSLYSHSTLQREEKEKQLFEQLEQNYQKDYQKYQNIFQQLRISSHNGIDNTHSGGKKTVPLIHLCHNLLRIVYIYQPSLIKKYNTVIDKIILKIKTKKLKFSYIKIFIEKYLCILLTLAIYLILFKTNIFQKIKDQFFQVYKQKIITKISKKFSKSSKSAENKKNKSSKKKQNYQR